MLNRSSRPATFLKPFQSLLHSPARRQRFCTPTATTDVQSPPAHLSWAKRTSFVEFVYGETMYPQERIFSMHGFSAFGQIVKPFPQDLQQAARSLLRSKGLSTTVVLTLALGIGANAAIFTLVRGVLLRPLVNRDENRLIYIRQSAPGVGPGELPFSVPEIQDIRARVKTLSAIGEFSTIGFTMIGLGEPREVQAGVV